jgi:hypothetical protein
MTHARSRNGYRVGGLVSLGALIVLGCSDSERSTEPMAEGSRQSATPVQSTSSIHTSQGAAALQCPPFAFANNTNLAQNPSFETGGPPQTFPPGPSSTPPSAATGWLMHTSNNLATITTSRVPTTVPGPGGTFMLHIVSGSTEGGVFQQINSPAKVMFSVWVFVRRRGHVFLELNGGTASPGAWSTKHGQWEQIRACSDGSDATGFFAVLNEDPAGGDFFIDRAEIREIQ